VAAFALPPLSSHSKSNPRACTSARALVATTSAKSSWKSRGTSAEDPSRLVRTLRTDVSLWILARPSSTEQ